MRQICIILSLLALTINSIAQTITLGGAGNSIQVGVEGLILHLPLSAEYRQSDLIFSDVAPNAYHGTAALSPVFTIDPWGYENGAFYVGSSADQNAHITTFPVIDYCAQADYTITFWIRVNPNPPDWKQFLVYGNTANTYIHFRIENNDKIIYQYRSGGTFSHFYSPEPIDDGVWHFIVFEHYWGGSRTTRLMTIYEDNQYSGYFTYSADEYVDGNDLYIGSSGSTCTGVYMCEFKIFNHVLTAEERTREFNNRPRLITIGE